MLLTIIEQEGKKPQARSFEDDKALWAYFRDTYSNTDYGWTLTFRNDLPEEVDCKIKVYKKVKTNE